MSYRYRVQDYHRRVDAHLGSILEKGDEVGIPKEWDGRKSVGDLVPSPTDYGEYVKVRDIAGNPVLVQSVGDWSGTGDPTMRTGPSLVITADLVGGDKVWFIVSHQVLYRKLNALRDLVPFLATFFKVDKKRYYDVE